MNLHIPKITKIIWGLFWTILIVMLSTSHLSLIYFLEHPNQLPISSGQQMGLYRLTYQYNQMFAEIVKSNYALTIGIVLALFILLCFIKKRTNYIIIAAVSIVMLILTLIDIQFFYIYYFIIAIEFSIYGISQLLILIVQRKRT